MRLFRVGSEPENVPIGVPNPHLVGPRKVLRRLQNRSAALAVLFVQGLGVLDAEPYPRPWLPLITFRQVDAGAVACHAREVVATPFGVGGAEDVNVVPHVFPLIVQPHFY